MNVPSNIAGVALMIAGALLIGLLGPIGLIIGIVVAVAGMILFWRGNRPS